MSKERSRLGGTAPFITSSQKPFSPHIPYTSCTRAPAPRGHSRSAAVARASGRIRRIVTA
ncbi:hypothetical protein VL12_17085 [Rossellomorea marisflavi]|nr:hypothetical protein VL12_17085 [Rossellomorea marisflavi]